MHATKAQGGMEVDVSSFLTLALGGYGQLHAPSALSPGKEPPVTTGQGAGWAPQPIWKKGKSFARAGCRNPDRPARSMVTILATSLLDNMLEFL
jgi:hypothetical protein